MLAAQLHRSKTHVHEIWFSRRMLACTSCHHTYWPRESRILLLMPMLACLPGAAFRCCSQEGLQRSVAVEVKSLATDAGRTKFVQLLRSAGLAPLTS